MTAKNEDLYSCGAPVANPRRKCGEPVAREFIQFPYLLLACHFTPAFFLLNSGLQRILTKYNCNAYYCKPCISNPIQTPFHVKA